VAQVHSACNVPPIFRCPVADQQKPSTAMAVSCRGCVLIGKREINVLLFASSQGQVEGQVKRLKVFKRQGDGRASPALLQARLMRANELYRT
jgi:hypothetical protein